MSNTSIHILKKNTKGELANMYSPLQNLVSESTRLIGDMRTEKLSFNRYNPVELSITDEYDGSTNIILNDDKTNPKLLNTRFSVQENNTYNIPIHSGNCVTNIYDEGTFNTDSLLLKLYKNIPTLYFNGIYNGGSFKCGSYVFYFKLSDADGNLTNTVQESGIVQLHIGRPGSKKIRMGMESENSEKCIKFKLEDIDSGFDYVRIFYERTSSDESLALIDTYFMIDLNFPIIDNACEILLTGTEPTIECSKSDLNNEFADIQTAKTQSIVDTTLFLGNVSAYELNYRELQSIAWSIIPEIVTEKEVGSINCAEYKTIDSSLYYDQNNVYYSTGYWPDELYRFGVVFIYDNNLLSPVFNLQGCDMSKLPEGDSSSDAYYQKFFRKTGTETDNGVEKDIYKRLDTEPEDYFFNKDGLFNSKGVFKLPKVELYKKKYLNMITPKVIGIKFNLTHLSEGEKNSKSKEVLKRNHIKGLFFVRQKRIPTIIAQGFVVGLTGKDYGSIPVLHRNGAYTTKSFLDEHRLLSSGHDIKITSNPETKALLVPDYEIDTATLNQLFTSAEFLLERVGSTYQKWTGDSCDVQEINYDSNNKKVISKLTAVQKETKTITDGENYFSTIAGIMDEPYKTSDVNHKWNKTVPQDLTVSTSLIRGLWGSYVGLSSGAFEYGDIVNIKIRDCSEDNWELLEFKKRFKDYSFYSAISPRKSLEAIFDRTNGGYETCYRGDCYYNVFTHRMMSNFIDGELPTNTKIIDPACWAKNYAVRCTAEILQNTHSNLTGDSGGWYIPSPLGKTSAVVSLVFGILTANLGSIISAASQFAGREVTPQDTFANEIAQAFEIYVGAGSNDSGETKDWMDNGIYPSNSTLESVIKDGHIKKVNPKEQEQSGGFNLKAIFKSDDDWELHGLASINRADVNAVSFGQWITFPVCSKYNLALRDIDFSHATEEASLNHKRAFYPWEEKNPENHQLESEVINGAAKRSLSSNGFSAYTTVPYIKQEYFNRIYWSKPNVTEQFINSYRMIFKDQYHEYNKEFGAITKLIPMSGSLLVVFQHGIGVLPVNRTPQSEQEKSPFLSSKSVLPTQVQTITRDYGSIWKDSVIKTPSGIVYGVDTVAKKIWRTNGQNLEFISDHKVTKFLNDWIDLSEYDFNEYAGHINVKTHYNEFKHDVMFTYYKDIPLGRLTYMKNPETEEYNVVPYGSKWVPALMEVAAHWDKWNLSNNEWDFEGVEYQPVDLSGNLVLEDTLDPIPLIEKWEKGTTWSLCYNEVTQQFITFYDWYPIESCNIDNIFFSFDKESVDKVYDNKKEKPVDLLKGVDGFASYTYNKVFMDKMFGENTTVYKCKGSSKLGQITPILNKDEEDQNLYPVIKPLRKVEPTRGTVEGIQLKLKSHVTNKTITPGYYSFYSQADVNIGNRLPAIIVEGANVVEEASNKLYTCFGKDSNWKFYVCKPIGATVKLTITKGCLISELHFTPVSDLESLNSTDPVLKYSILREGFLGECLDLWKHGMSGLYDNQGKIKPTNWYGKQHEFNFEFIVNQDALILKIFNNLKIISNKTEPNKFEYEVVGEGYDWFDLKPVILWINKKATDKASFEKFYKKVLTTPYDLLRITYLDFPELFGYEGKTIQKLPFLHLETCDRKGRKDRSYHQDTDFWDLARIDEKGGIKDVDYTFNTSEVILVEDDRLNEQRVHTESLGNDVRKYGRLRGNMQYLEDLWDVEIRPIKFQWAYVDNNELKFAPSKEARHRDKYIKVKVRYTGKDLAVIQGIITMFDYSMA